MNKKKLFLLYIASFSPFLAHAADQHSGLDGFPPEIAKELIQQRNDEAAANLKSMNPQMQYLINIRRWGPGETVLVAFNGGPPALHRAIANTALEWTKYANVKLDFGYNPATGTYRRWSTSDQNRAAHIRIGFADRGYWSALGSDSLIDRPFAANKPSMNFQKFVESWPNLMPSNWKTVVLHEFGHALGFRHEHQQQVCFSEVRWQRGPNGEPDVYDVFKQWQGWERDVVDVNLKPANLTELDFIGPLNTSSIMYYATPEQAYINGRKSKCFIPRENLVISSEDARGAMLAYPKDPSTKVRVAGLDEAGMKKLWSDIAAAGNLNSAEKDAVGQRLKAQSDAQKPLLYIQIQGQQGMALAKSIQAKANSAGYFAPGIEDVKPKKLKSGPIPEIRYFRDIDEEYANQAADLVREVTGAEVKMIKNVKLANRVTRNLVELWLP